MSISTLPFYQQLILDVIPPLIGLPVMFWFLRKTGFLKMFKSMMKDFEPKENICNCPRCSAEKNRKAKIKFKAFNKKDWK